MRKTALQITFVIVLALATGVLSACQSGGSGGAGAGGAGGNAGGSATQAVRTISGEEALELMKSETDYVIVDVRTESEFAEKHIPGALNIPLDTISGSEVAQLPNKDQLIMLYCRSGNRSAQAAGIMVGMDYTNLVDFGGIKSWPGEVETGAAAA